MNKPAMSKAVEVLRFTLLCIDADAEELEALARLKRLVEAAVAIELEDDGSPSRHYFLTSLAAVLGEEG